MSSSISVRIPDGKLGTVRVDRTVDIYPTLVSNNEAIFNAKLYIPKLVLQRQSTAIPIDLIIENSYEEHNYNPIIKWNNSFDDEDISDIAVIYSLVRCASTRRTSVPALSVLPLSTNVNIPQPYIAKSYTLESPLTPIITHVSKQAQIKILPSTRRSIISTSTLSTISPQLVPPTRIQTSTSFTSHDRPSIPLVAIKPRPYSFRITGRSVIERKISNITERVSQLHESFLSRLSHTPHQPRNRSLSTFQSTLTNSNTSHRELIRPRPKSETYEDHRRVNSGKDLA
jgi:hypothetical protein